MIGRLDFSSCDAPDFTRYHESAMGGQFSVDVMFASFSVVSLPFSWELNLFPYVFNLHTATDGIHVESFLNLNASL